MEYKEVLLGDIADVQWGDTSTTKAKYTNDGYKAFSASGNDGNLPYYDYDREGIVLSAIGAACGRFWYTSGKWSCIKNTIHFWSKDEKNVLTRYLFYAISPESWIISGSAQPFITLKSARNYKLRLPDLEAQRKIVHILSCIDEKIELNSIINEGLTKVLQTDFERLLEENSDAELVSLEDCVNKINTGADAIQRAPIVDYDTGIRCIRIGDMTNSRDYYDWGFTKMTKKDFENYKLIKNDIVITRTAINGLTYFITTEKNTVCNNGIIRLRVNDRYNPLFIFLNTKTKDFRNYIDRINGETSVRPNMKVKYLTDYPIRRIDLNIQNSFCNKRLSMLERIRCNKDENQVLKQLKKATLPKLLSGKINLDKVTIDE